jgi:GT2 family glycosyltransferase
MGVIYKHPSLVKQNTINNHPVLSTAQGGLIYTDRKVIDIWNAAPVDPPLNGGGDVRTNQEEDLFAQAVLACLVEAGLLQRQSDEQHISTKYSTPGGFLVSAIIVCHNSLDWLKICLPSLKSQLYSPIEIILVDNASEENIGAWLQDNHPDVLLYRLDKPGSLASAINFGITKASGNFFLLLNPDTQLEPDSISEMVGAALKNSSCAAVAAKLKFLWAPSFLNGLGNYVGGISWGTDSALGHLDLGQFDHWKVLPSACFAAALIPASAWKDIGELDEGFPMYYEDSEWCYRARLMGYQVLAAPGAVVLHAFSGQITASNASSMEPLKLRRVAYGRLRFVSLLLDQSAHRLPAYFLKIFQYYCISVIGATHRAYQAWNDFRQTRSRSEDPKQSRHTGRSVTGICSAPSVRFLYH